MSRLFVDNSTNRVVTASTTRFDVSTLSVAFWIYRTAAATSSMRILGADDGNVDSGWRFDNFAGGGAEVHKPSMGVVYATTNVRRDTTNTIALNTWVHIVGMWDGGTPATSITFYVDGVADAGAGGTAGTGAHVAQSVPFAVGAHDSTSVFAFPCRLAEIGIWNRVISANEAQLLANGWPPIRVSNGLIGYFPLYGAGTEPELTGSGLTGTVTGATQADHPPVSPPFGFAAGWFGAFTGVAAPPPAQTLMGAACM